MKLLDLELSGFRGFSSKEKIDLSADATIVVGANGLGKTSLLDAIQWGLCGKHGRHGFTDERLLSVYSTTGQARVVLRLQNSSSEFEITRVFDGKSQTLRVSTGGRELRGASAKAKIFELLWPEAEDSQDGEEALSLAITRSVYLQQDRLRNFLEGANNQERFNIISELVGAGRLTELQSQLDKERLSWSRQTTKQGENEVALGIKVAKLEKQLEQLEQTAQLGGQLSESKWSEWWARAKELEVGSEENPSPTSSDAASRLDRAIRDLQAMRNQNRRKQLDASSLSDLLANRPPVSNERIGDLEEQHASAVAASTSSTEALKNAQEKTAELRQKQIASQDLLEQRRALAQLALKLLGDKCPVCEQDFDLVATKARLESIVSENRETVDIEVTIDLNDFAERERKTASIERAIKSKLDEHRAVTKAVAAWEDEVKNAFNQLGIDKEPRDEKTLRSFTEVLERQDTQLLKLVDDGERLSLDLAKESANAMLKSTANELEKAKSELAKHRLAMLKREDTATTAKLLIEQLREARSKVAIDKLSEIEPLLQRTFARIDPHPTFRAVKLATDFFRGKGRLDAEISDAAQDKASKYPETILSSSQLNALAVSLFLSFNLALPKLPLRTAIFDDPFQSLDDINLLGLIDLLRRTKEHRQIIVSTHDPRFGELLARKLRPGNDAQKTSVVSLSSWNREGPEVEQYQIEPDLIPLRLAAV